MRQEVFHSTETFNTWRLRLKSLWRGNASCLAQAFKALGRLNLGPLPSLVNVSWAQLPPLPWEEKKTHTHKRTTENSELLGPADWCMPNKTTMKLVRKRFLDSLLERSLMRDNVESLSNFLVTTDNRKCSVILNLYKTVQLILRYNRIIKPGCCMKRLTACLHECFRSICKTTLLLQWVATAGMFSWTLKVDDCLHTTPVCSIRSMSVHGTIHKMQKCVTMATHERSL